MLYLIKSATWNESGGLFFALKIGFTDNWSQRFIAYKTHNPNIELLCKIEEGIEEHEKALQWKFRKYSIGREWFKYNDEIVDYFKNVSIDELNNLPKPQPKERYDFPKSLKLILPEDLHYLVNNYPGRSVKSFKRDASRFYYYNRLWELGIDCEKFGIKELFDQKELLSDYYKLDDNVSHRLRFICESVDHYFRDTFLGQLTNDDYAKSYYLQLGPDRCRALSYNIARIKKELGIVKFDRSILEDNICLSFKIGDKLKKSVIKEMLTDIYKKVGYTASPKATDLGEWFEIESTSIREGSKNLAGFKIIRKK